MLCYFELNTCIVTTVSGVSNTLTRACDAALAANNIIKALTQINLVLSNISRMTELILSQEFNFAVFGKKFYFIFSLFFASLEIYTFYPQILVYHPGNWTTLPPEISIDILNRGITNFFWKIPFFVPYQCISTPVKFIENLLASISSTIPSKYNPKLYSLL